MSQLIESRLPCDNPKCLSSDAVALYSDHHKYCFSCGTTTFPDTPKEPKEPINLKEADTYVYKDFRGVPALICEKYNCPTGLNAAGEPLEIYYSYVSNDPENEPAGKRRILNSDPKAKKLFLTEGDLSKPGLFGAHVHPQGSKKSITITEGEQDALSVDYVLGDQTASVSVRNAATAKTDCINNRDYINSFDRIIFWFDNDTAGKEALAKCIPLFDFNKTFIVNDTKFKDANDYLQHNDSRGLNSTWRAAKRFTPDSIISTFSEIEKALEKDQEACIATYPFAELQHNLFGMHRGEVIVFKAGEGIGKTETFRAIEHHVLKTTDAKIGIIHLEEDSGTTIKALATYELGVPCVLPDSGVTKKEILDGYKAAVGGREDRVFMHDHFGADDPNVILDNIRFLVSSCGCDIIFLDHIGLLVNTQSAEEGERMKLDYLSNKLKFMAKELGFCLVEIAPTNDDGQTRGSRNISKVANSVIHVERDLKNPDPTARNTTFYTIDKARLGGRTGPAGKILFDTETYKMREFEPTDHRPQKLTELKVA